MIITKKGSLIPSVFLGSAGHVIYVVLCKQMNPSTAFQHHLKKTKTVGKYLNCFKEQKKIHSEKLNHHTWRWFLQLQGPKTGCHCLLFFWYDRSLPGQTVILLFFGSNIQLRLPTNKTLIFQHSCSAKSPRYMKTILRVAQPGQQTKIRQTPLHKLPQRHLNVSWTFLRFLSITPKISASTYFNDPLPLTKLY